MENKQAIATQQEGNALTQEKPKTIKDWLQGGHFKSAVRASLPSHLTPERFVRVALTALMRTPKLQHCSQASLFKAMLDCSSLGLEPDGRRAHLIPYGKEVQLIIDYKGLIELGKRSGEVKNWRAELVCENDKFGWENGIVTHKVDWFSPRGKVLAVYSHVRTSTDVDDYEIMTLDEVSEIRKRSKAGKGGPWSTDFNEMAKKTVIRRHSKRLTLSPEFIQALEKDDDRFDEIDVDFTEVPDEPEESRADSIKKDLGLQATKEEATQTSQSETQQVAQPKDEGVGF